MSGVTSRHPRIPKGLLSRIRRFVLDERLVQEGDMVLVGVSGGSDSTCLLIALASLQSSFKFQIRAAHLDHKLRGKRASTREAESIQALAKALDVQVAVGSADVKAHAKKEKQSLEEAAREVRYEFLARQAAELNCNVVAVGHTQNDQAETVLLHLIRGSGLRGLAAMSPLSDWPFPTHDELRLIRPLLDVDRSDTEAACAAAGVTPVDDPSNRSNAHTRARIRNELLPVLRQLNPRIVSALARLANATTQDIELLETMGRRLLEVGERRGEVRIDRRQFASSPPAIQRHAIRLAVKQILGDSRNLSDKSVHSVLSIADGPTGASINLARKLRVTVGRRYVTFSVCRKTTRRLPARAVPLQLPGQTTISDWKLLTRHLKRKPNNLRSSNPFSVVLDANTCGTRLQVRRRRTGDRLQPLGMATTKKLQDFLVDAHVPREERDNVPLVVSEHGIVWVAGHRPAEWAKVTAATENFLRITASS